MSVSEISESGYEWQPFSLRIGAGETLIDFGQFVCQPFFWACQKLALEVVQPKDDRILAIFKRCVAIFIFTSIGVATALGWLVGSGLKIAGAALSGKPFVYAQGKGAEHWDQKGFSLLSFNVCMYESGFPILLGGVMPANYRTDRLAQLLKEADADIVLLQELSLGPSELLMKELEETYPHFYTNIGSPTAWLQQTTIGPELFIASKSPIVSEPRFVPYTRGRHKLGFFCLETPTCWIINAHFPEEAQDKVLLQVSEQVEKLRLETGKPCVLAGDLNYRKKIPEELFHDAKELLPTCTNLLGARLFGRDDPSPPDEVDDFILIDKDSFEAGKMRIEEIKVLELPDWDNPRKALSDHRPVFAQVRTDMVARSACKF